MRTYFECTGCHRAVEGFLPVDPRKLKCMVCGARNPIIVQRGDGMGPPVSKLEAPKPTRQEVFRAKAIERAQIAGRGDRLARMILGREP